MNSVLLLILQGTVHVKIDPNSHCVQYCIEQTKKMIMNQGDICKYYYDVELVILMLLT